MALTERGCRTRILHCLKRIKNYEDGLKNYPTINYTEIIKQLLKKEKENLIKLQNELNQKK